MTRWKMKGPGQESEKTTVLRPMCLIGRRQAYFEPFRGQFYFLYEEV